MTIEERARLTALELLVAHLVADKVREMPDRVRRGGSILEKLLVEIGKLHLDCADLDEEAQMRVAIGDEMRRLLQLTLDLTL